MGQYFTDKFSLLHFAMGIIVYYWNVSLLSWFIVHFIFEYTENTEYGIKQINKIKLWPGGKEQADTVLNSLGDQFYSVLGWIVAYYICNMA
jgi:hypothetical protein